MYTMNIYNLFYKAPAPEGIEERKLPHLKA